MPKRNFRRPNGKGSITKKKDRRKPYETRVTLGFVLDEKNETCKQRMKHLGYFETKIEAERAIESYIIDNGLAESNDYRSFTFKELYDYWFKLKKDNVSMSSINSYKSAFSLLEPLHNKIWIDLLPDFVMKVMINSGANYPTLRKMQSLICQLTKKAMELKMTNYNLSDYLKFDKKEINKNPNKIDRQAFEKNEIDLILNSGEGLIQDVFKFMIYTGVRISELLNLKIEDVDLETNFLIITKSKTDSGTNRLIPIHNDVKELILRRMNNSTCGYVFYSPNSGIKLNDSNLRSRFWEPFMKQLKLEKHRFHDCRVTFKTYATRKRLDNNIVERILGHKVRGLEGVYDKPTLDQMQNEIKLLSFDVDVSTTKLLKNS